MKNNFIKLTIIVSISLITLFYFLKPTFSCKNLKSNLTPQSFYQNLMKAEQNDTKALKKLYHHYLITDSSKNENNTWMVLCKGESIRDKEFQEEIESRRAVYQMEKKVNGVILRYPNCPKNPLKGLKY